MSSSYCTSLSCPSQSNVIPINKEGKYVSSSYCTSLSCPSQSNVIPINKERKVAFPLEYTALFYAVFASNGKLFWPAANCSRRDKQLVT